MVTRYGMSKHLGHLVCSADQSSRRQQCSECWGVKGNNGGVMRIVRLKTAVEGNFDWTFVRLETDEGIQGLGECFFAPGLTAILRSLEPLLTGEDPRRYPSLVPQVATRDFRGGIGRRHRLQRDQRDRSRSVGPAGTVARRSAVSLAGWNISRPSSNLCRLPWR